MTTSASHRNQRLGPPTRAEIAVAVSSAFGAGAVHRDQILGVARGAGVRPEVLELLARLPAYRYQTLDQLWRELPRLAA